ncbi:hypothetical protein Tco_0242713 [Tanacetum coccineum]
MFPEIRHMESMVNSAQLMRKFQPVGNFPLFANTLKGRHNLGLACPTYTEPYDSFPSLHPLLDQDDLFLVYLG